MFVVPGAWAHAKVSGLVKCLFCRGYMNVLLVRTNLTIVLGKKAKLATSSALHGKIHLGPIQIGSA